MEKGFEDETYEVYKVTKRGYVTFEPFSVSKGGGSAFNGGVPAFPGRDATKSPGEGYKWRGQQPISGEKGAWYNCSKII